MSSSNLEKAFQMLTIATDIEQKEKEKVNEKYSSKLIRKSANQYLEACHLLKVHVDSIQAKISSSETTSKTKLELSATIHLLLEKITHYTNHANILLQKQENEIHQSFKEIINEKQAISASELLSTNPSKCARELLERANLQLTHALDLDEKGKKSEAIQEYMVAAEILLKGYKIAQENQSESHLELIYKRRLQSAIDRVEILKKTYKSSNTGKSNTNHLSTPSKSGRKTLSQNSNMTLVNPSSSKNTLSADEIKVLKESSLIVSGLFMPWSHEELKRFPFNQQMPWRDPKGVLRLSSSQKKRFHKWARPSQIVQMRGGQDFRKEIKIFHEISPYSIQQNFVTDCSFIASLVICAAYEKRIKRKLITLIIYPQDKVGNPIVNPSGRYVVRLWLNGVARSVEVDDFFPVDRHGNILCSHTNCKAAFELWVCLIEKAYMKLCGGYDFPGSNSGIDLFALTGWIPEQIYFPRDNKKIQDYETSPERAWTRLLSAHSYGDCLITMSCSNDLSAEEANRFGLVTGHAYAVLKVVLCKGGEKLLQVKNPWAYRSWCGKYSATDSKTWANNLHLQKELGYTPSLHQFKDDGIFWISWLDVLSYFQNLHLSWNPALFSHKTSLHRSWPASLGPKDDSYNIGENPQYIVSLDDDANMKKASLWILLSRHVNKQEQEGKHATEFLSLHVNRNSKKKERLYYPNENRLITGAYLNNPHVLLRYDIKSREDKYLTLILSQYQKSKDMNYTLSCYCTSPFRITPPSNSLQHDIVIKSEWNKETAGGPPNSVSQFVKNPMWKILIPEGGSKIQIQCKAPKTLAINMILFRGSSEGKIDLMARIRGKEMDSGPYRSGFAVTSIHYINESGHYTLVPSTYEPDQVGGFVLTLSSSSKLLVEKLD